LAGNWLDEFTVALPILMVMARSLIILLRIIFWHHGRLEIGKHRFSHLGRRGDSISHFFSISFGHPIGWKLAMWHEMAHEATSRAYSQ
jgi:hypothetical protein